jgi:hypothetical protein
VSLPFQGRYGRFLAEVNVRTPAVVAPQPVGWLGCRAPKRARWCAGLGGLTSSASPAGVSSGRGNLFGKRPFFQSLKRSPSRCNRNMAPSPVAKDWVIGCLYPPL